MLSLVHSRCTASAFSLCKMVLLLMLVSALGCRSAPAPAPPQSEMQPAPAPRVTLKAGDVVEIKFAYAGQFNESQSVRPDGVISLQIIGEIVVAGKTPSELRDELIARYTPQLKHPELSVVVRSLSERRVYVGGEVNKPGLVEMPGDMTLLEAIMQAGGFNLDNAEVRNVVVARITDGMQSGYGFDLEDAISGKQVQPFYLKPRDIVYVPRTRIADVDQWVSQYLYKLLPPVSIGFNINGNGNGN
jgi:protein involved in polysaccharide export with SLBB domain